MNLRLKGNQAERYAETFLAGHKLVLVQRNYRCRFGEIDLIMRDGETLVFVEVRMRTNRNFGGAGSSITLSKQRKVVRAARHYLLSLRTEPCCRFDAVLLSGNDGRDMEWIRNAFDVNYS
ncbi:YraN family protein [Nitrosospira multiformis]|uniref:YraN family protein n=1 Tax=Nitrosospira multiformis TaxID=1231 RepID=UPI00089BF22F|nr:YraN family protein [Nitrosospira multiformis]SDZ79236.1 putative endonuclease [Nitrosospira multiformis]